MEDFLLQKEKNSKDVVLQTHQIRVLLCQIHSPNASCYVVTLTVLMLYKYLLLLVPLDLNLTHFANVSKKWCGGFDFGFLGFKLPSRIWAPLPSSWPLYAIHFGMQLFLQFFGHFLQRIHFLFLETIHHMPNSFCLQDMVQRFANSTPSLDNSSHYYLRWLGMLRVDPIHYAPTYDLL